MSFAMYLRELRHTRQMPQVRLADALGIRLKSLVELESGRRPPSVRELRELAAVFKMAERELMLQAGYLAPGRPR